MKKRFLLVTLKISGSFHGPLSERMQPPLSAQVQVPPRNSGNSLMNKTNKLFQVQKGNPKKRIKEKFTQLE